MTDNDHGIAGEAHGLVYGARAATYGHPRVDFSIIAKVWTGLLQDLLKEGAELDPYRVAVLMTGLKLARLVKSPTHRDSRMDTIGYMLTMERLDESKNPCAEVEAATGYNFNDRDRGVPYIPGGWPRPVETRSVEDQRRADGCTCSGFINTNTEGHQLGCSKFNPYDQEY